MIYILPINYDSLQQSMKANWRIPKSQTKYLALLLILLSIVELSQSLNCLTSDPLIGCITCDNNYTTTMNITDRLITCVNYTNCSAVDSNGSCIQCVSTYVINTNNTNPNSSIVTCQIRQNNLKGCKRAQNSLCVQCLYSYYLNTTSSTCKTYIIDYCWKTSINGCAVCSDENIISTSNCSVSANICDLFDYEKWTCLSCGNKTLHESGVFCYDSQLLNNCLIITTPNNCLQCKFGYILSNNTCQSSLLLSLQYELLDYTSSNFLYFCIDRSVSFQNQTCSLASTNYCTQINGTVCITCVSGFYIRAGGCLPCSSKHSNCLSCTENNCWLCEPKYFVVVQTNSYNISVIKGGIASTVTRCLPCSIYGCQFCRNRIDSKGILGVVCDKCLYGYKLYNHTCIRCSEGFYFSLSEKVCVECTPTSCAYCNDITACEECKSSELVFSIASNNTCQNISLFLSNSVQLTLQNIFEILNKSLPLSSTIVINDQKLLMTNCLTSSNGFACICDNSSLTYTSLCSSVSSSLSNLSISSLFNLSTYNTIQFKSNLKTLLLLSELPQFSLIYSPSLPDLITIEQFAYYLQIKTNYIRNHVTFQKVKATQIAKDVFTQFRKIFPPYKPTILSGPGYYFKYTPNVVTEDDASVVSLSSAVESVIYIYFQNIQNIVSPRITGNTYIFTNPSITTNLRIKKINFLKANEDYAVYENSLVVSKSVSSDSQGFLTISSVSTNLISSLTINSYYVSSIASTNTIQTFDSQRIENIIYKVAFIYILVFLVLYLTLIPCCAIFDCVDKRSTKRIKQTEEQGSSYQGIKHKSESDVEEGIILKINYKDFFPIYNIANTERPRRLLKLCLFLVNSQHSITFLTLIYFHLPGGQPLIAVLLAIPAYFCTVIMGYICGLLTLKLPGKTKYLINIITLGYWILWVPIMSSFVSYQYAPYVFTFAIIFFFVDMLIDFLETLLVYFTIKQESRQQKLFSSLSRWLSYRGYYQFDKMAREIGQIRDNS